MRPILRLAWSVHNAAMDTPGRSAQDLDDDELAHQAKAWRARALRGERHAFGIAQALEAELRRRQRASRLQNLPLPASPAGPRPWWKVW